MEDNNILHNPLFSKFFMTEEQKLAKKEEKKLKTHIAISQLYTYGAQETGLEEVPLKDLYAYFFDEVYYNDNSSEIPNIVKEISNRVLKKLKTPGVGTDYFFDDKKIMGVASTHLPLGEIDENTSIDINVNLLEELSLFAVFHECKHVSQKYALHNLMQGFKTDNNEAINGVVAYLDLADNYKYFPYSVALDELDANIYGYNIVKRSLEKGMFNELSNFDIKRTELYNYIQAYEMLKSFKVVNGQIDSKLQKQLIDSYKQGVKNLREKNLFTEEQLQSIEDLDIDAYFKSINKQLFHIENDFKLATIDYQHKYGVNILENNSINHDEFHLTMTILMRKMIEAEQKHEEQSL